MSTDSHSAIIGKGPCVRACELCGAAFRTYSCALKKGNGRFCSLSCKSKWWANTDRFKARYATAARERVSEPFEFEGALVCRVLLTKGKTALIDAADAEAVAQRRWYFDTDTGYARSRGPIALHRFLLQPLPSEEVDHLHGHKLDNRRCKLRIATRALNQQNVRGQKVSSTGVRGVEHRCTNSFRATIMLNHRTVFSKSYRTLAEAEAAVKQARAFYHPFSREALEAANA